MTGNVPRDLRSMLSSRMKDQGWSSIREFHRGARVPYTIETIRRAFNECEYKSLSPITLAVIMVRLGFSPSDTKRLLKENGFFNAEVDLIGDVPLQHTVHEEALVEVFRDLCIAQPSMRAAMANHIDTLGGLVGVDTRKYTDSIRATPVTEKMKKKGSKGKKHH